MLAAEALRSIHAANRAPSETGVYMLKIESCPDQLVNLAPLVAKLRAVEARRPPSAGRDNAVFFSNTRTNMRQSDLHHVINGVRRAPHVAEPASAGGFAEICEPQNNAPVPAPAAGLYSGVQSPKAAPVRTNPAYAPQAAPVRNNLAYAPQAAPVRNQAAPVRKILASAPQAALVRNNLASEPQAAPVRNQAAPVRKILAPVPQAAHGRKVLAPEPRHEAAHVRTENPDPPN
jgi:hypothetical protein